MSPNDLALMCKRLQGLYGDRWPGLTKGMFDLWYDALAPFPAELAPAAVKRWATEHIPSHMPTLADLTNLLETLQSDQRREAYRAAKQRPDAEHQEPHQGHNMEQVRALIRSALPGYCDDNTVPEMVGD